MIPGLSIFEFSVLIIRDLEHLICFGFSNLIFEFRIWLMWRFLLIYQMLQATADRLPDKPALLCNEEALTYRELQRQVFSLAYHLQKLGVRKGDPVALLFPNCIGMAVSYYACAAIGAMAAPLNNRLTGKNMFIS